ncbi:bifunctional purine biosynthesis protein PurH [Oxobacter pfennigii]|uniref:Bifunctional purine biosynthesis protein PurH n=1 Tax=Oxobacter pfennigii TaxID=36849 RepID=A0A0P8X562_9CLOT|nr:bifunctional phosphoribosylaminoimidazolecarboxamide formyltransferase/IMP cyclohydrolase [Oxobacter pfennigii]KPU45929.1 bifunctional purine biosynthesis protein PurH [Oxobacter pfennigii]
MIKTALISVFDKSGIVEMAEQLSDLGVKIISTGGTEKTLKQSGLDVINISDVTGFPECLDGRVKTLHPKIHAGILAMRDNKEHMEQLEKLNVDTIDMIIVNLYPFKQTISKEHVELEDAIENIDIGGPTMLRAAAKNYKDVVVIVDPQDYRKVLDEIKENGDVSEKTKFYLAFKVFNHTAAYDALISSYLKEQAGIEGYTDSVTITFEKVQDLRYGENPHQSAAFYKEPIAVKGSLPSAIQLHGKELSFNNINDANAAVECLKEFEDIACVAVKHANPCGVGVGDTAYSAYIKAYECDPVSIFGGIIAINDIVDKAAADEINKIFVEIVIAPDYTGEALEILKSKKNIRVMKLEDIKKKNTKSLDYKKVNGGLLIQNSDNGKINELKVVTNRKPTNEELKDLNFAWKVVKHLRSNAIALAKSGMTIGLGPGQTNRIWAAENAIRQAGEKTFGCVLASDAFFPFPDVVEAAAAAGITAIIQPGGSLKDDESIELCNKHNIAMVFTGMRHFKH